MSNKYPGGIITSGANAGYSVFFDGTGDYLSISSAAALQFGAGDFTIEAWVYPTSFSSSFSIASKYTSGNVSASEYLFLVTTAGKLGIALDGGGGEDYFESSAGAVSLNTWAHCAVSKSGTTVRLFVNGVQVQSGTSSRTLNSTSTALSIGVSGTAGYAANARIVKGTALYTAAFTPPTQLFNITNTSLLTCNSPAIVDQSSNAFTITANGNAAVSTFTPFTGTQLVPNPNTLANTQGVWSISDAAYWMSQNKWPMPSNYPLQSLRFNIADTTYLNKTFAANGNRKTWTMAFAFKRGKLGALQSIYGTPYNINSDGVRFEANDTFLLYSNDANNVNVNTTQVFRDTNSWYFFVVAVDTTQVTAANRVKMYVNGVQITAFATASYPALNYDFNINSTVSQTIGRNPITSNQYLEGYLADFYFIDGQQLTPSSFGAIDANTGVWSPTTYGGTYGTNGFRLSFQDNTNTTATTLGKDWSGQGNNWTPNNFSVAAGSGNDSLTDTPTNWGIDYGNGGEVRGNYATLNPLNNPGGTFTNGNLDWTSPATDQRIALSSISIDGTAKWYSEFTIGSKTGTFWSVGVFGNPQVWNPRLMYRSDGARWIDNTQQGVNWASYTTGDVIGISYEGSTGVATFYKNGVLQGSMTSTSPTSTLYFGCGSDSSGGTMNYSFNAGQRPFANPAPPGFKCLCTTNLPIPVVGATSTTQANRYFDVALHTGNGGTTTVSSLNFQPDLVWIKSRSNAANHGWIDSVRGLANQISSSTTAAEISDPAAMQSFNSNGFTVANSATGYSLNTNTYTYADWCWNAGGSTVTNTSGTISSQVRANTTAGISIVGYTANGVNGATVGHGLGVAPRMIIVKRRNGVDGWPVYHASLGATQYVQLESTAAAATSSAPWNNTAPTSSVFTIGTGSAINTNGATEIVYCFAEIAGFSKFGSYTGNGSADGPFIFTGFRPRFVLIKSSSDGTAGNDWVIIDTARNTFNESAKFLRPNLSNAEGDDAGTSPAISIDILSNGFKVRGTSARINTSSSTYIFAVFAEAPFNYSRAR